MQQIHTSVLMQLNFAITTTMFRPLVWPSSGWYKKEYNSSCNMSVPTHGSSNSSWSLPIWVVIHYIYTLYVHHPQHNASIHSNSLPSIILYLSIRLSFNYKFV